VEIQEVIASAAPSWAVTLRTEPVAGATG